jgi:hypothetical protein
MATQKNVVSAAKTVDGEGDQNDRVPAVVRSLVVLELLSRQTEPISLLGAENDARCNRRA